MLSGGVTWISFYRREEEKATDDLPDPEIKAPKNKRIPIYFFYYTKIVLMLFSYFFIIIFLIGKL
jgi:hypothetical protein